MPARLRHSAAQDPAAGQTLALGIKWSTAVGASRTLVDLITLGLVSVRKLEALKLLARRKLETLIGRRVIVVVGELVVD